jgi:hypothetical protein
MVLFLLWWCLFRINPTSAQEEFRLNVTKTFGFSSGSQIRGAFTAEVIEAPNIHSVTFRIDKEPIGNITQAPWKIQFNTKDFTLGWHELDAEIQTIDGRRILTTARRYEFVSADEESQIMQRIIIPLFVGIFALIILTLGGQILFMRNKPNVDLPLGSSRKYGFHGGSICPRCHRPFALHWWGFNLGFHKFDRCDYCGKWSMVRPLNREALKAAENAELEWGKPELPIQETTAEEQLKQQLDNSRYQDKL